jgi:hypothetical protein
MPEKHRAIAMLASFFVGAFTVGLTVSYATRARSSWLAVLIAAVFFTLAFAGLAELFD